MSTECIVAGEIGLELHWDGKVLAAVNMDWSKHLKASAELTPRGRDMAEALKRYARGQDPDWPDVPLALDGLTPFTRNVLTALRDNGHFGTTLSYGELAELAGRPGAARAVGQVMARNRWPLLIPCHRVLASGGKLGGFSGGHREDALALKAFLLQLEGVR